MIHITFRQETRSNSSHGIINQIRWMLLDLSVATAQSQPNRILSPISIANLKIPLLNYSPFGMHASL